MIRIIGIPVLVLLLTHLFAFPVFLDFGTNLIVFCANLFALLHGIYYNRTLSENRFTLYLAGYSILFIVFLGLQESPLLFSIFVLLYASMFRRPHLLGHFFIFVFCLVLITPYWFESFLLLSLFYAGMRKLRRISNLVFSFYGMGFLLLIFIIMPIMYLISQTTPQTLTATLQEPKFHQAILTSLVTTTLATAVVALFGIPLAYVMAKTEFPGKGIIDSIIDLPILIPQTVAGIALLVFLGPKTPLGAFMKDFLGIKITGTYLGIIAAQIFVSAPFLVRSAISSFQSINPKIERVSRTLGASELSTFFRISFPMASHGIFTGAVLTWCRAMSEVGSLMVLAYRPFTAPILVYDEFIQYGLREAQPIAVLLLVICFWLFVCLRWMKVKFVIGIAK